MYDNTSLVSGRGRAVAHAGVHTVTEDASVSRWLDGLKAGDDADIARLWERYFRKLVALARAKLPARTRREFDEEDVALSAFHSFCARAGRGEFPRVADRNDLWRLLSTITARKVTSSIRHRTRLKRGGGRVLGESALVENDDEGETPISQFLSREPSPEDAAAFTEDYDRLFDRLNNPTLRTIALRRLEGSSSEEIGVELGVSARTVDRKIQLIRALWEEERPG
jgi:DNA-directed RNA polymerase specialized sigma24 family protein